MAQGALGTTVSVPTVDGDVEMTVAPGAQSGDVFTLKGHGVPHLNNSRSRGDQLVALRVKTPRSLTNDQRALLEQLAETLRDDEDFDDEKGWFGKFKDSFTSD